MAESLFEKYPPVAGRAFPEELIYYEDRIFWAHEGVLKHHRLNWNFIGLALGQYLDSQIARNRDITLRRMAKLKMSRRHLMTEAKNR